MIDITAESSLRSITRRVIHARLGMLDDPQAHYAEDVATLLALLKESKKQASKATRSIRIEERLRLK